MKSSKPRGKLAARSGRKRICRRCQISLAIEHENAHKQSVHPEDRTLLGSNLSAAMDSYTAGLGGFGRPSRLPAGTINVPSWSPDSKNVAFVSYQAVYP